MVTTTLKAPLARWLCCISHRSVFFHFRRYTFPNFSKAQRARAQLWMDEIFGEGNLKNWIDSNLWLAMFLPCATCALWPSFLFPRNGTYANVRWLHADPVPNIRLPIMPHQCDCELCRKGVEYIMIHGGNAVAIIVLDICRVCSWQVTS